MLHERGISLDARLMTIAEMVGRCPAVADIGCDHGRLGAFLLQRGWVGRALLMDVSDTSLDKARALIRLLGLAQRARFLVCDGAEALNEPIDAAVIAGMGGATAAGIVERGRGRLGGARLILQVNVGHPELRRRLAAAGYRLTDERIVRDGRRLYVIMEAQPGKAEYDERELHVGPILLRRKPEELSDYAAFRLRVARKALDGARQGGEAAVISELEREIAIWEEAEAWL